MRESRDAAEHWQLQELVTKMFVYADSRDWHGLRNVLADQVYVDYTSLNGGQPATIAADDLVSGWAETLGALEATQHLVGNLLVESLEADRASVSCYAQATHFLPGDAAGSLWTLGAHYLFKLERADDWRIDGVTMTTVWDDGNRHLMARVRA